MSAYTATATLSDFNSKADRSDWSLKTTCPACAALHIAGFATIRSFRYYRCGECGFVFANPAPSERAASEFYNSAFYNNYRTAEEEIIERQPYFSISAYTDPRRLAGWLTHDKAAHILDFGCGPASFIALLRDEFGFSNVEGLELNTRAADIARRCYGIVLTPTVDQLKQKSYDVVILFEVIEHLTDPESVVKLCRDLLAPGGHLFITTPSVRNIPGRFMPSHCGHYTGPSHVSLFTETAMERLLDRVGFEIERLETDPSGVLGRAYASPLYDLDFSSPQSSTDVDDGIYVPNRIGRALGLKPTRKVRSLPFRVAQKVENVINRFVKDRYSDHLYLLAKRRA
ncbi:class I SAM-dependent methyltransferase [Tardiphaga sp. 866_E4_N2_1]|uniref:class I SAM-dependent methyltransferase n=1 Tax=unclassified Tardiphaga TaxID=2631404 RepID=UPI003F24DE6C